MFIILIETEVMENKRNSTAFNFFHLFDFKNNIFEKKEVLNHTLPLPQSLNMLFEFSYYVKKTGNNCEI